MNRNLLRSTLGLALVASVAVAHAGIVNGTSTDPNTCFISATGTLTNIRIPNYYNVTWGSGNVLTFLPKTFTANTDGGRFKLGSFRRFNSISGDRDGTMNVSFQAGLGFGSRGAGTLNFNLGYVESRNTSGYGGDYFTLPGRETAGQATIDGRLYNVKLAGFGNQQGSGVINGNQWFDKEMQYSTIDVYGELEAQPVPEPATMAVLGLGAAAMLRRRRK